jgi:hypothetical protein
MFARIVVREPMSEDDRRYSLAPRTPSQALGTHTTVDHATGNRLTIAVFDGEVDLAARATEIGRHGSRWQPPSCECTPMTTLGGR